MRTVFIARLLALAWALFWLFFFVAESLAWNTPLKIMAAWVGLGLLFLSIALLSWTRRTVGGLLLIVAGASLGVAYPIWAPEGLSLTVRAITTVVFGGPPLLAGVLLLRTTHRRLRSAAT